MRSRYRGSLLVEIFVGMALSMVALTLAVPLLRWSVLGMHQAETDAAAKIAFDHAVDLLRRDAWQAQKIQLIDTPAGNRLILITPTGSTISWRFDRSGIVSRMDSPTSVQSWKSPGPGTRIASDNGLLILMLPASPPTAAESIALTHPISLLAGGHP